MIVVRLAGGLGNQIFQLGVALYVAKKHNTKKVVIDDSSLASYEVQRVNELNSFFNFEKANLKVYQEPFFLTKLRLPIHFAFPFKLSPFVGDRNLQVVINAEKSYFRIFDGYFQSSLNQSDFDEEIALLKDIFVNKYSENKDGCVIHIRGGDFVKLGWNSVTPKEYYASAIKMMREKYDINKFYIVSDDKEYSTSILNGLNIDYEFIGGSMEEDFYLINSFQKRILSSSTFALWASALGDNDNSIVIAPEFWTPDRKRKIFLPNERRI